MGVVAILVAVAGPARAQVGSANVPLPNVLLLLDTSGSFEHMIDGSNPEDSANNTSSTQMYANCESAANATPPVAALPNRWGVAVQALTGTILNSAGQPWYSCVTMDRIDGPVFPTGVVTYPTGTPTTAPGPFSLSTTSTNPQAALATAVLGNGLDMQYGLVNESKLYAMPYDSGYYLNFHRPVSAQVSVNGSGVVSALNGRCVYSPGVLPGAINGGTISESTSAPTTLTPATGDCGNETGGICLANDFPSDAIKQVLYDAYPTTTGYKLYTSTNLTTPNMGFASGATSCTFNQLTDGFIDQGSTLVRFGLMTFDNDPSYAIGVANTGSATAPVLTPTGYSAWPYTGQWSYFDGWTQMPTTGTPPSACKFITGEPAGCPTAQTFELGARNPGAPPWEGRLIPFPPVDSDVLATAQNNSNIQLAINAMRPYGATPTAAMMTDAAYYFWKDPQGPSSTTSPDPFVAGGCRAQYIILLTDGGPNQDMRPACQATGGKCPYHLPEETASILAAGSSASEPNDVMAMLPSPPSTNGNVYTYVIGFAVSNSNDTTSANCAQLAASGQLQAQCNATLTPSDTAPLPGSTSYSTLESPCCSLQRIAVAGQTKHAYFADTPGDLQAALAAVLGDIEGQLGSRTIPVASPTISYGTSIPLTSMFFSTFQGPTCPTPPCPTIGPWTGDVVREDFVCPSGAGQAASTTTQYQNTDDFSANLVAQASGTRNFLFFNAWDNSGAMGANAYTVRPYLNSAHIITNSVAAAPSASDNLDTFHQNGQDGQEVNNFGSGSVTSIYTALTQSCTAAGCPALATTKTSCQDPASTGYPNPGTCANLALSFAMAQSNFPLSGTSTTPASNLQSQYATGTDGPNTGIATNRSASPFGAVLDSTPAVVAPPSALVRDDSYQQFVTALSPTTLTASPRRTMLYVATVDGLLHAFDTTVGLPQPNSMSTTPQAQGEAWSFIPPAVLPRLISNYPGANNVLLDGAPVVKDVVFSRKTQGGGSAVPWVQEWHTMLVAGFGQGGPGYYALDVTDPRWPTSNDTPASDSTFTTSGYPTYVQSATNPVLTGPHFQWQITNPNTTGNPLFESAVPTTQLFGSTSGTPVITTVYADPTLPPSGDAYPQEIGVAILPGGHTGLPIPGATCPRELTQNSGHYSTQAPLYAGNTSAKNLALSPYYLADTAFPARSSVRAWSQACSGSNSNVPGRSVMVVSIATGQVLAVFARAQSSAFSATDPTTWDVPTYGSQGTPVIDPTYLIKTPLDSPMTGTPVVYPSGVGVVAQEFFIGDADGTMWRFDISDPNPLHWTGALFADAYSPKADVSGTDSVSPSLSSPDWPALDSQAISVPPVMALDSTGSLTMNFATGDQTAFNACYSVPGFNPALSSALTTGSNCTPPLQATVNFLYSVREARTSGNLFPHAQVQWYQEWTTGERVTGPMAIFNGALYFATYLPPGVTGSVCTQGGPNLYAFDFANPPKSPVCSKGALNDDNKNVGCGGDPTIDSYFGGSGELTTSLIAGVSPTTVIPGVAVTATPSCTQMNNVPSDAYTGGSHTSATNTTPGSYSLTANIGKKGTAAKNVVTQKLKAPSAPTVVDSWATIAE